MTTSGKIGVSGIKPSGNELTLPAGSTTAADHCVIPARDVIRPRRGTTRYSTVTIDNDATDANSNRAKEMYQWGTALFVNYTGNGGYKLSSFSAFATAPSYANVGSFEPPDPATLRMKFAELAKCLLWTTNAGLYILDVVGGTARAAGLTEPQIYIFDPDGGIGTRLSGNPSATGSWFAKNQTVAGRAVCCKRDTNARIVESAPSGRAVVVNPNDVTVAIGNLVRNANVVTATVTSHKFRVGDILDLTLSGGDIGNFDTTNNVVTAVTATTIVWAETAANYTNVAQVTITSGTKSIQWTVRLTADMAAGDFVRIYRTDEAAGEAVDPGDECFLSYERTLTATDISNGYVIISDTTPSSFLRAPLSTNPNTGEGPIIGRNDRPPLAKDICVWDGRLWSAETTDRHRLTLSLIGTGSPSGLQTNDIVAINCRAYVTGSTFAAYTQYLATENVDKTTYFMAVVVRAQQANTGVTAFQRFDGNTGLGQLLVEQLALGSTMADSSSGAINAIYAATSRTSAFGDRLATTKAITAASTARTLGTTVTVRCTGHGFSQGQIIMLAFETVDANFPPGLKTVATVVDADNFTYTESGSNATLGQNYHAYATTFKSDDGKRALRFSRQRQPESWPLTYFVDRLPDGATVLRVKPTPDGGELMVFLKNGDIYALSGSYPYSVRRVDGSAQLVAADSLVEHANRLHGLTTQGPATIGSVGVGVFGGDIEDEWRETLYNLDFLSVARSVIWGLSYESDRQYQLWVPVSADATATRAYVFHSGSGQWSRWPSLQRSCGLVFRGPDLLFTSGAEDNRIYVERKAFGSDLYTTFADNLDSVTVNGNQSSVSTITVNAYSGSSDPVAGAGDLVSIAGSFYRVTAGAGTSITISGTVTVTNGQTITLYRRQAPVVTFAVEAVGVPGIEKQFRELQLHFGRRLFQTMTVTFTNEHSASESKTVSAAPSDFVLGSQITRPSTVRMEVPDAMKAAAMLTISLATTEAYSYFDLLGYSVSYEPIAERTGK